jgi:hypothetical protein
MDIVFALIIGLLLISTFWFIGHLIRKIFRFDFSEENQLLKELINIGFGGFAFLISINLIGNIIRDFNIALALVLAMTMGIGFWQKEETLKIYSVIREYSNKDKLKAFFNQYTDRCFWILIGVINFIYGLMAVSTFKLDRNGLPNVHIFNINQLLAGKYPPEYSFLPGVSQKYHYGSDILGATVSRFSNCHPDISLDVLTLLFLNLSILLIFTLTIKFLNTNNINKYLIPFAAFLAWGPITSLFIQNKNEILPVGFLNRLIHIAQNKLTTDAQWSGMTLNWFFNPPTGFSIFFFFIAIYLLYRFFNCEDRKDLKYGILIATYISGLFILDASKFLLIYIAIFIYMVFSKTSEQIVKDLQANNYEKHKIFLRDFGIITILPLLLSFIYGNWFNINSNYISLIQYFTVGSPLVDKSHGIFSANIILVGLYILGFYQAYKKKCPWTIFLIPFFAAAFISQLLFTLPNGDVGKVLINCNLIGAFVLPYSLDFIKDYLKITSHEGLKKFYIVTFSLLSISTLTFWLFSNNKPLFRLENNVLRFSGLQALQQDINFEDKDFAKYITLHQNKNNSIIIDPEIANLFSISSGVSTFTLPENIFEFPLKNEFANKYEADFYRTEFSYGGKSWLEKKIGWAFLTPNLFRFYISPEGKIRLLSGFTKNGVKLAKSANGKELLELNPSSFPKTNNIKYAEILSNFNKTDKKNLSQYLKSIAECPYWGIYNSFSNDYDGDKIIDFAFFDAENKKFYIVNSSDLKEKIVSLDNIISEADANDTFSPMPSDYDGDGKTDIALFNRTKATWHIIHSSDLRPEGPIFWGGLRGETPLPGDIDGDGKFEIATYVPNRNSGNWPTVLSTKPGVIYRKEFPSTPFDIPMYADVDGDKKSDYVIYRPSESQFYIYNATCSATPSAPQAVGCGIPIAGSSGPVATKVINGNPSSRAVIEDFDGDKKYDLATWTPESGKWEISYAKDFLSAGAAKTPFTAILGMSGDIPLPADYNGDGKAEIAIYNAKTLSLEIMNSDGTLKTINLSKYKDYTFANFIGL